jgi:hypothetical protein
MNFIIDEKIKRGNEVTAHLNIASVPIGMAGGSVFLADMVALFFVKVQMGFRSWKAVSDFLGLG